MKGSIIRYRWIIWISNRMDRNTKSNWRAFAYICLIISDRTGVVKMLENSKKFSCAICKQTFEVVADVEQYNQVIPPTKCLARANARSCTANKFQMIDTPPGKYPPFLWINDWGLDDSRLADKSFMVVTALPLTAMSYRTTRSTPWRLSRLPGDQDPGANQQIDDGNDSWVNGGNPPRWSCRPCKIWRRCDHHVRRRNTLYTDQRAIFGLLHTQRTHV